MIFPPFSLPPEQNQRSLDTLPVEQKKTTRGVANNRFLSHSIIAKDIEMNGFAIPSHRISNNLKETQRKKPSKRNTTGGTIFEKTW